MERRATEELQAQLQSLRSLLVTNRDRAFPNLFDEFIQQHEFELALHTVCDFILDPDSPRVDESTLDQIQRLHAAMKIDDGCVEELRNKKLA